MAFWASMTRCYKCGRNIEKNEPVYRRHVETTTRKSNGRSFNWKTFSYRTSESTASYQGPRTLCKECGELHDREGKKIKSGCGCLILIILVPILIGIFSRSPVVDQNVPNKQNKDLNAKQVIANEKQKLINEKNRLERTKLEEEKRNKEKEERDQKESERLRLEAEVAEKEEVEKRESQIAQKTKLLAELELEYRDAGKKAMGAATTEEENKWKEISKKKYGDWKNLKAELDLDKKDLNLLLNPLSGKKKK